MLRTWVQERLERGTFGGAVGRRCSAVYAHLADPVRPIALPGSAEVIGVGGPTLGGSSKTPIVAELARRLAASGERVAVVAHGYRARPRAARRVAPDDAVELVGDDALCLARELRGQGVPVFVAPERRAALALAAQSASLVIVDALLQTRPIRLSSSVLVFDRGFDVARARCPPAGDLRAALVDLLRAADVVLLHRELAGERALTGLLDGFAGVVAHWNDVVVGARSAGGERATLDDLRRARVGLVLGVARPERVVTTLARLGVRPSVIERFADHAAPRRNRRPLPHPPELWLTTPKCATRLPTTWRGAPVWTLERRVSLDVGVRRANDLDGRAPTEISAANGR